MIVAFRYKRPALDILPREVIDGTGELLTMARKLIILVVGGTMLIAGIAMIVLPGPAIVFIPLSLAIPRQGVRMGAPVHPRQIRASVGSPESRGFQRRKKTISDKFLGSHREKGRPVDQSGE
ncbi:MAG: PGPGW domain-containing protein [Comamonadaceae bacterium]|nr:PGPGW domain-containing protein [Comamonadaceae bacterium]